MKIYSESIPLQSSKQFDALNILSRVKAAIEKSGLREGICMVSASQSDCAVLRMQDDSNAISALQRRIEHLSANSSSSADRCETDSSGWFHAALLGQQLMVPFSEGRLDLDPGETIFLIELNGIRPRRVVLKILGE